MLTNRQFSEFCLLDNFKEAAMTAMEPIEDIMEKMQAMHVQQMQQTETLYSFIVVVVAFFPLSSCALVYCPVNDMSIF